MENALCGMADIRRVAMIAGYLVYSMSWTTGTPSVSLEFEWQLEFQPKRHARKNQCVSPDAGHQVHVLKH